MPPDVPQFFLPLRGAAPAGSQILYSPGVLATGTVNFVNTKTGPSTSTKVMRMAPAPEGALALDWDGALTLDSAVKDLERRPYPGVAFAPLPAAMEKLASYRSWSGDFAAWAFAPSRSRCSRALGSSRLPTRGRPKASSGRDCSCSPGSRRDDVTEKIRKKYATKMATLQQHIQRAEHAVEREAEQAKGRKVQTAISFGATIFSAFTGRKVTAPARWAGPPPPCVMWAAAWTRAEMSSGRRRPPRSAKQKARRS